MAASSPVQEPVSLDDLVLSMMQTSPAELTLPKLEEIFNRLDLSDELLDQHITFAKGTYARNLICRTPRFDMLLLCWKPGNVTTVHDHCGSLNVIRVHKGSLTSRRFEVTDHSVPGKTPLRKSAEETLVRGDKSSLDVDGIHQLANTSKEELVTLHLYAPPLKEITVYSPTQGTSERLRLRYTLEDEFA